MFLWYAETRSASSMSCPVLRAQPALRTVKLARSIEIPGTRLSQAWFVPLRMSSLRCSDEKSSLLSPLRT